MTTWNPSLYLQYGNQRTQPAIDLTSRIASEQPRDIIDLGCGTGNSTAILKSRWPDATVSGLDSSPDMLAKARESDATISWLQADLDHWQPPQAFDIIFSNAAFQWVADIEAVLTRLFNGLSKQGVLAFQVPNNTRSPFYKEMIAMAESPQWRDYLDSVKTTLTYKDASYYYDLLNDRSSQLFIWETEYFQVMEGAEGIIEWASSTSLSPYLQALPSEDAQMAYKEELLERYRNAYPAMNSGKVLFPFNRQFVIAYR